MQTKCSFERFSDVSRAAAKRAEMSSEERHYSGAVEQVIAADDTSTQQSNDCPPFAE